jgi:hypothetical protein
VTLDELAVVGTSRARAVVPTGTRIDDFLAHLPDLPLERRVLLAAGALTVYERAGLPVADAPAPPEPAEADALPPCSTRIEAIVREMVACDHHVLLPEAFRLIARAGQRLAPTLLPVCLDLRDAELRGAVRPLLDARGRWLARQRDDWQWAIGVSDAATSPETLDRVWDVGSADQRLAALAALRARDPAHARDRLAATWAKEKVDDRLRFLRVVADSLDPSDDAWLESVLNDRSRAVRSVVAALLVRLPASACARRAVTRASACLTWESADAGGVWNRMKSRVSGGANAALRVTPPAEADAEWERDGVEVKPPKGAGERAHWLTELLAQVNPAHWSARFEASPADLCGAAWRTDWAVATLAGWSRAALLHETREWIPALWDIWMQSGSTGDPALASARAHLLDPLFAAMPVAEATSRLPELLARAGFAGTDLAEALRRFPRPWSDEVADVVVAAMEQRVRAADWMAQKELIAILEVAAAALPAARSDDAVRGSDIDVTHALGSPYVKARDRFVTRITLRKRLSEEIGP